MLTKGLFSGCPCSARKYFYPQPTVLLEWSTSGMLSNVLITVDRCKRNNKSFLPFTCFPDVRVLWSDVLDPLSKMALLIFISCSQCIPFKITDSQQHVSCNLLQTDGFPDLGEYGNSKSVTYLIDSIILLTAFKNAPVRKA